MDKFVIEGGYPLSGTVVPAGNKNAALPILAASLLTDEELVVGNPARLHRQARFPVRSLDRPGHHVLEPAEGRAAVAGQLGQAESVVRLDLLAAPGARLSAG